MFRHTVGRPASEDVVVFEEKVTMITSHSADDILCTSCMSMCMHCYGCCGYVDIDMYSTYKVTAHALDLEEQAQSTHTYTDVELNS